MKAIFFRLLTSPIPAKGTALLAQVTALNAGETPADVFPANPADFAAIPGSPFAYWAGSNVQRIFGTMPLIEGDERTVKQGLVTADDFRFLRSWWEIPINKLLAISSEKADCSPTALQEWCREQTTKGIRWISFAKGGVYSPFYADMDLVVDWENDGERIKQFIDPETGRTYSRPQSTSYYFQFGLTWPLRTTSGISFRPLPSGCIFSHKGPAVISENGKENDALALLAIVNSAAFSSLISLQLGAATLAARSYEVGLIQRTPLPNYPSKTQDELAEFARQSYNLARQPAVGDETAHVFCLPALLRTAGVTFIERLQAMAQAENERQARLATLQAQIDTRVAELYGVPELASANTTVSETPSFTEGDQPSPITPEEDDDEGETASPITNPHSLVADFLMWCIGVAFGRWDIRYALHPETIPPLPGPFDPLPVYSPGMLTPEQDADGTRFTHHAATAFLVDDPTHARDIVTAVRAVFNQLWPGQADDIAAQACQLLGVPDLRTWLRDPKGFFAWHIKRYSKSRRKAPIYWLIQSARKNYAIWLYYPRLNPDSLFFAAREFADAKHNLELSRLEDLQRVLERTEGSVRKSQERAIAQQTALVREIKTFIADLDTAALLEHKPDLNDGVLLNIAPLHALVPWKEPQRTWDELLQGKYAWSAIATHLRKKKLVKPKS